MLEAEGDEQGPAEERADHREVTLGEVDQPEDAVNDGVAERHQGIEGADREPDHRVLEKRPHPLRPH